MKNESSFTCPIINAGLIQQLPKYVYKISKDEKIKSITIFIFHQDFDLWYDRNRQEWTETAQPPFIYRSTFVFSFR